MRLYVRIAGQWYSLSPAGLRRLQARSGGDEQRLIRLIRRSGRALKSHPRRARTHPTLTPLPHEETP